VTDSWSDRIYHG